MKISTAPEALMMIQRELLLRTAQGQRPIVCEWRFFPYPCSSRRIVIACAELADGTDVQELFELDAPIDLEQFDENAMEEAFLAQRNSARH